jgi:hypothetical protein
VVEHQAAAVMGQLLVGMLAAQSPFDAWLEGSGLALEDMLRALALQKDSK